MENNDTNPLNKREEFYKKLKESLDNTTEFPADYLFKFIVPTNHSNLNIEKENLQKEKEALNKDNIQDIKEINDKIENVSKKIKIEDEKLAKVDDIFKNTNADIQTKKSKSGKYTSKTIKVKMDSSDDVIKRYKDAEGIEGIISL